MDLVCVFFALLAVDGASTKRAIYDGEQALLLKGYGREIIWFGLVQQPSLLHVTSFQAKKDLSRHSLHHSFILSFFHSL